MYDFLSAARSFHVFTIQISKLNWAERAEKERKCKKKVYDHVLTQLNLRHSNDVIDLNNFLALRANRESEKSWMQKKNLLRSAHTVVRAGICHFSFFYFLFTFDYIHQHLQPLRYCWRSWWWVQELLLHVLEERRKMLKCFWWWVENENLANILKI